MAGGLDTAILGRVFQGGVDTMASVGAVIAGGHTIRDNEPKYGLAVTGVVRPDRIITKAAARPGDVLVLTKPLGTGTITTAAKNLQAEPAHLAAAIASMKRLNEVASRLAVAAGVRAGTDITGFGLLGHADEIAAKSGVGVTLDAAALPWLDGALAYAAAGVRTGGNGRNRGAFRWACDLRCGGRSPHPAGALGSGDLRRPPALHRTGCGRGLPRRLCRRGPAGMAGGFNRGGFGRDCPLIHRRHRNMVDGGWLKSNAIQIATIAASPSVGTVREPPSPQNPVR